MPLQAQRLDETALVQIDLGDVVADMLDAQAGGVFSDVFGEQLGVEMIGVGVEPLEFVCALHHRGAVGHDRRHRRHDDLGWAAGVALPPPRQPVVDDVVDVEKTGVVGGVKTGSGRAVGFLVPVAEPHRALERAVAAFEEILLVQANLREGMPHRDGGGLADPDGRNVGRFNYRDTDIRPVVAAVEAGIEQGSGQPARRAAADGDMRYSVGHPAPYCLPPIASELWSTPFG